MRRGLIAAGAAVLVLTACVDLFHDTDFVFDKLVDASVADVVTNDAPDDAPGDASPRDFCELDVDAATTLAHRSCALLAACARPYGQNATGKCLERALPIVACKGARGHRVHGDTLAFWKCLTQASTCQDVNLCVVGGNPSPCDAPAGAFTRCIPGTNVRAYCAADKAAPALESCVATGRTCSDEAGITECTGAGGLRDCRKSGCEGTWLHACAPAPDGGKPDAGTRDDGFDCNTFGARACVVTATGAACAPEGPDCGAPEVKCTGPTTASGCIGGKSEVIDCTIFGGACHAELADSGVAQRDLTQLCAVPTPVELPTRCEVDVCSRDNLTACVLGNRTPISCATLFGTKCNVTGGAAACEPPP